MTSIEHGFEHFYGDFFLKTASVFRVFTKNSLRTSSAERDEKYIIGKDFVAKSAKKAAQPTFAVEPLQIFASNYDVII